MEGKGLPHYQEHGGIVNGLLIAKLLKGLQLYAEVTIVNYWGHQFSKDPVALGNARADSVGWV